MTDQQVEATTVFSSTLWAVAMPNSPRSEDLDTLVVPILGHTRHVSDGDQLALESHCHCVEFVHRGNVSVVAVADGVDLDGDLP